MAGPPGRATGWFYSRSLSPSFLISTGSVCRRLRRRSWPSSDLTKTQMGAIFSAFAVAYALFEIPGGWMGDWMGARKVLIRIVIWWSVFTAVTGYMWSFASMFVAQFLFGAGEAGGFPNLTKALYGMAAQFRARSGAGHFVDVCTVGRGIHTSAGCAAVPLRFLANGVRALRSLGAVWAVAFYFWYRDNPKDHKGVNEAELALLAGNVKPRKRTAMFPGGSYLIAYRGCSGRSTS